MKTLDITIAHKSHTYPIMIGSGLISNLAEILPAKEVRSMYIVTDHTVERLYLDRVKKQLKLAYNDAEISTFAFTPGERSKKLETVELILQGMAAKSIDRKSLVVNLGGGVVTDLGGFAASIYMRGVPFINISTTLEGMVDASVGGKTGVNLGGQKNYIGTFSHPEAVIIDIDTLKTLPKRVLIQGYAEVIKHGLIADKQLFHDSIRSTPSEMNSEELIDCISRSIHVKRHIVQEDETEQAARKLLNFGHTVGHVIESLSFNTDNPLYHGEAVAIGMIAESFISQAAGMISQKEFAQIEQGISGVGLPTRYKNDVSLEEVLEGLKGDKKNEGGKIKWTLLMGIGVGEFNVSIGEKYVRAAIEYILLK